MQPREPITLRVNGEAYEPPRGLGVLLESSLYQGSAIYLIERIQGDVMGGGYFSRRYRLSLGPGERLDVYCGDRLLATFIERNGRAIDPAVALR